MEDRIYTAIGSSNIAFIKYWGKRDGKINLPNNSSISMTLDRNVGTKTSVLFSSKLKSDRLFINGKEENIKEGANEKSRFISEMLAYCKKAAGINTNALIVSENNFPSDSGLASSASGGATLAFLLSNALDLKMDSREISIMARKISGSACRSVYGGIVKWDAGSKQDGSDSFAEQVVDHRYWPDLMDIIAIVDPSKKKVSSSAGHAITVKTSSLYRVRPQVAEEGVKKVVNAVTNKDFQVLAETVMRDSNNMHATMMDSWPPIMYLSDASRSIIYAMHELNESEGKYVAAYTFDAGPNAHIITTSSNRSKVIKMLEEIGVARSIIESKMGAGPEMLEGEESLIDQESMAPVHK
ncbi:MAG: diphosphomevalonate decarboxylase [Candidatus Micrarchaeales archaeon]|jgi:diphosphomevalonate decarboxylase|uniref:Diphosphomevalonate decarboxylase n=1 Tax=Candidatus Micrarchaeum acidiphilum ARMAN-2 TaxID=425595 RepID=C7DH40_MICA2|nr:MAG: diphosphomevalonate decarboxylase [Candidatus Micrarchaeum acidiphilum ARMAN-2]MCW6161402.1 diphosphomevalonate decarboxylase [Candidatus Micrarchaeales archaeon]